MSWSYYGFDNWFAPLTGQHKYGSDAADYYLQYMPSAVSVLIHRHALSNILATPTITTHVSRATVSAFGGNDPMWRVR
jgi:predicted aminopeptidase